MAGGHYSVTGAIVNGQPLDASKVKAALDNIDEATYQVTRGYYPFLYMALDPATLVSISGGVLTITQGSILVGNETPGLPDQLDTISGGVEGQFVYLKPNVSSDLTTIGHMTGNIYLSRQENMVLTGQGGLLLFFDGTVYSDGSSLPYQVPTSDILAVQVFS